MASREAILRPIADADSIFLNEESVDTVVRLAGGYPYFIQFICREVYDVFIQRLDRGQSPPRSRSRKSHASWTRISSRDDGREPPTGSGI